MRLTNLQVLLLCVAMIAIGYITGEILFHRSKPEKTYTVKIDTLRLRDTLHFPFYVAAGLKAKIETRYIYLESLKKSDSVRVATAQIPDSLGEGYVEYFYPPSDTIAGKFNFAFRPKSREVENLHITETLIEKSPERGTLDRLALDGGLSFRGGTLGLTAGVSYEVAPSFRIGIFYSTN